MNAEFITTLARAIRENPEEGRELAEAFIAANHANRFLFKEDLRSRGFTGWAHVRRSLREAFGERACERIRNIGGRQAIHSTQCPQP